MLTLNPHLIMQGHVWRLVTYIFIPQLGGFLGSDFLGVLLYLWFLWFIGDGLEEAMGAAKLNLFYLIGMIGTTIAAFFFGSDFSSTMLNASLFYAFARYYPDVLIYVFYILPMKIKWMAWISGCLLIVGFVVGGMSYRMAVIAALSNYLIFFGPEIWREAGHRVEVRSAGNASQRNPPPRTRRCTAALSATARKSPTPSSNSACRPMETITASSICRGRIRIIRSKIFRHAWPGRCIYRQWYCPGDLHLPALKDELIGIRLARFEVSLA